MPPKSLQSTCIRRPVNFLSLCLFLTDTAEKFASVTLIYSEVLKRDSISHSYSVLMHDIETREHSTQQEKYDQSFYITKHLKTCNNKLEIGFKQLQLICVRKV